MLAQYTDIMRYLLAFLGIGGTLSAIGYVVVKYGKKTAENKTKDEVLKETAKTLEVVKGVATNTPSNDDDILDRLQLKD